MQQQELCGFKHDRFINNVLSELYEANRSPIYGYQHLPLLPLEEAVEKILPFIPNLVNYVWLAKQKCNRDSTLLTWDESAAIYLYSMPIPVFSHLNKTLRDKNRYALKPWFSFLRLLIHALNKLPSLEIVVWRGISSKIGSSFAENNIQTWWSINSCSKNLQAVQLFLCKDSTLFAIKALHGKDISSFSTFQTEHEVVLLPGTRLRVQSNALNFEDQLFIVYLEEESQPIDEVLKSYPNINTSTNNATNIEPTANIVIPSLITEQGLTFTSDVAQLWEQCDGKEYKTQRMCAKGTRCFARDISYWQCRPTGNCPKDWACTNEKLSTNSSLSLEAITRLLSERASKLGKPNNWPESIVDLMKLLGQNFQEHRLIELARKLGYSNDVGDSYKMHLWLHKQIIEILAKNGGDLPTELKD